MKIALFGYGKMGKTIEKLAVQKGHTIVAKVGSQPVDKDLLKTADVAIEFSVPEAAVSNLTFCFENNIPVVSGTTGWLDNYSQMVNLCESRNGSFIYASNFSIGVNLFFSINEYAAKLMRPWNEYKVSIDEIHHTQKLDAPSGTAISLAEAIINNSNKENWILDQEKENELTIRARRVEDVKGTHIIKYQSNIDSLSLKHEAHSREGFAMGAIIAAEWLINKQGVYTMKDVLQLNN